jgi:hypothetical protein
MHLMAAVNRECSTYRSKMSVASRSFVNETIPLTLLGSEKGEVLNLGSIAV